MIDCNETLILMDPGTRLTKITGRNNASIQPKYRSLIGMLKIFAFTQGPELMFSLGLLVFLCTRNHERAKLYDGYKTRYYAIVKRKRRIMGDPYKHNRGKKDNGYSDCSTGSQVNISRMNGYYRRIILYYGESYQSAGAQHKRATASRSSCWNRNSSSQCQQQHMHWVEEEETTKQAYTFSRRESYNTG
ncbi:hypothetical protein Tco_0078636 [Tanacetum coccineum]